MSLNMLLATTYAADTAEPIATWLTVGVVAAFVAAGIVLFFAKREVFAKYVKFAAVGFVFYALILGMVMLILNIIKNGDPDYLTDSGVNGEVVYYVFIPLFALFALALVGGILLFSASVLGAKKPFRVMAIVFGCLLAAGVVAVGVLIGVYYFNYIAEDGYYNSDTASVNQVALYVCAAVLVAMLIAGALFFGRKDKSGFDSRCIALAGVCVAMSFALSYVKLWEMPQGGTVTLVSLLPLMIFAYIYGPKKGVLAGFVYGILQAVQDPYIIHPAQFLLDYPVAFAMIGFAGLFAGMRAVKWPQVRFTLGAILAAVLRFASHVLSGVFAFEAYAGGSNVWAYSLAYNSFVFVDMALVVAAGIFVFSSPSFIKKIEEYANRPLPAPAAAEKK